MMQRYDNVRTKIGEGKVLDTKTDANIWRKKKAKYAAHN